MMIVSSDFGSFNIEELAMFKSCSRGAFFGIVTAGAVAFVPSLAAAEQGTPSVQEIIDALKIHKARGLSMKSVQAEAENAKVIEDLRIRAATGAPLTKPERSKLAEAADSKPSVDLEVYFELNSAEISPKSREALEALATALQDRSLKEASIMIAGHTDAAGRADYNQSLSERRAQAVRAYLEKNYNVRNSITIVGYGSERLKAPLKPFSGENRRVQIVNITSQHATNADPSK